MPLHIPRLTQLNLASVSGALYDVLALIKAYNELPAGVIANPVQANQLAWCQQYLYRLGLESWPNEAPSDAVMLGVYRLIVWRRQYRKAISAAAHAGRQPADVGITDAAITARIRADDEAMAAVRYLERAFAWQDNSGNTVELAVGALTVATINDQARPLLYRVGDLETAVDVMQTMIQQETRTEALAQGHPVPVYDNVELVFNEDLERNDYEAATSALVEGDVGNSAIADTAPAAAPGAAPPPVIYEQLPPVDLPDGVQELP